MADLAHIRHLIHNQQWSTARAAASGDVVALEYVRTHATSAPVATTGIEGPNGAYGCGSWSDSGGNGHGEGEGEDYIYGEANGDGYSEGYGDDGDCTDACIGFLGNGDGDGDMFGDHRGNGRGYRGVWA